MKRAKQIRDYHNLQEDETGDQTDNEHKTTHRKSRDDKGEDCVNGRVGEKRRDVFVGVQ
jgi:hypothetical protein